jgi:hypothetical protein
MKFQLKRGSSTPDLRAGAKALTVGGRLHTSKLCERASQ